MDLLNALAQLDANMIGCESKWDACITMIIKEICIRRFGKEMPIGEPSEEIRLSLVSLVQLILTTSPRHAISTRNEFASLLWSIYPLGCCEEVLHHLNCALLDPRPEIKKSVCGSIQVFIRALIHSEEQDKMSERTNSKLLKQIGQGLVSNTFHQHSKVRSRSLCALQDVLVYCLNDDCSQGNEKHLQSEHIQSFSVC